MITAALGHLCLEAGTTHDSRTGELPGLLLSALLLRLAPPTGLGRVQNDVFHRFRDAVEEDFRVHHPLRTQARVFAADAFAKRPGGDRSWCQRLPV